MSMRTGNRAVIEVAPAQKQKLYATLKSHRVTVHEWFHGWLRGSPQIQGMLRGESPPHLITPQVWEPFLEKWRSAS